MGEVMEDPDYDLPVNWRDPKWREASRVHDWRNYIPDPVKVRWATLSEETRLIVSCMAQQRADREVWD